MRYNLYDARKRIRTIIFKITLKLYYNADGQSLSMPSNRPSTEYLNTSKAM